MLTRWEKIDADIREALSEEEYEQWQTYLDRVESAIRTLDFFRIDFAFVGRFQFKIGWLIHGLKYGKFNAKKFGLCLKKYYCRLKGGDIPPELRKYFKAVGIKKFWN